MIRILVVDDSLTARKWVQELIENHPDMEVAGEALDGKQAIAMTKQLQPDVIVMEMCMPLVNGVEATRQIMASYPTPIVVLSSAEHRPASMEVVDALRAGAVEAVEKPGASADRREWSKQFLETLRIVSRVRPISHISASLPIRRLRRVDAKPVELVAIGASTGGPATVASILAALLPLPVPVLVVLHFPDTLFELFVGWISSESRMPVVPARDGASLRSLAGRVCLAVPGRHLLVSEGQLVTTDGPAQHSCKPAVDVLFKSVAECVRDRALAVLLTGMGRDGAEGMLRIREAGGRTIAQDEATSVVFGMPKAAIELNAADEVLPDREIADAIVHVCGQAKREVPR